MPTLFCKPENNFANRLITILSCFRLAIKWGYNFVVIWEIDKDKSAVFHNCFSEFFQVPFEIIHQIPRNKTLIVPEPAVENGRTYYSAPLVDQDVLIAHWDHVAYDISDHHKSWNEITKEFRACSISLLSPANRLQNLCGYLGYKDLKPDIAVHWRSGAWVIDGSGTSCLTDLTTMSQLVSKFADERQAKEIFICGSNPIETLELATTISVLNPTCLINISRATSFEPNFINSGIAILDFLTIQRAKLIINSGVSTFSALSALLGAAQLVSFAASDKYYHREAILGSGYGL
jgi:hypothetical protein